MGENLELRKERFANLNFSSLEQKIMKKSSLFALAMMCALAVSCVVIMPTDASAQRRARRGAVCGDPTVRCRTTVTFESHDLPFAIPRNGAIWESEFFYAVVLRSVRYAEDNCQQGFIPERDRLAAQAMFPNNKVFATRCAEPGNLYYTGVNSNTHFMAIYGGRTRAEAARVLTRVQATGQFPGANIRRMSAAFNGT